MAGEEIRTGKLGYRFLDREQPYDKIGDRILGLIESEEAREIRFALSEGSNLKYKTHSLPSGRRIDSMDGFSFIHSGPKSGLPEVLKRLDKVSLPKQIRVVCPNEGKDSWGVFYKYPWHY